MQTIFQRIIATKKSLRFFIVVTVRQSFQYDRASEIYDAAIKRFNEKDTL